jgi:hypothetical protein
VSSGDDRRADWWCEEAFMQRTQEQHGMDAATDAQTDFDREAARERVVNRRELGSHLVAYIVINAFLIAVWAFTGAGYFWPVWVIAGWGAGLVLHAWEVFFRRPVTEADVDTELRRTTRR